MATICTIIFTIVYQNEVMHCSACITFGVMKGGLQNKWSVYRNYIPKKGQLIVLRITQCTMSKICQKYQHFENLPKIGLWRSWKS